MNNLMRFVLLVVVIAVHKQCSVYALNSENTPPIISVDRDWRIAETAQIESVVKEVYARDNDNDTLQFFLELIPMYGPNAVDRTLPFRIDEVTGTVYLKDTLIGRAGESFLMSVGVNDGQISVSNQVFVNIVGTNDRTKKFPNFGPPPFQIPKLPTIASLPIPQSRPGGNLQLNPVNQSPFNDNSTNSDYNKKPKPQTKTYLENSDDTVHLIEQPTQPPPPKTTQQQTSSIQTSTSIAIIDTSQVLPIVITVISVLLIAGIIAVIVFRDKICRSFSRKFKSKKKVDKTKKSNQSIQVINLSDETSTNSMVMTQWNGPMAYNNRYTPWNMGSHEQAFPQISNSSFTHTSQNGSKVPGYDSWEFPRHRLKVFNILGEGAFGQVWRCEATDIDGIEGISTVAVKTLKENVAENEKNDLMSELQVMKSLEPHVNVVRLLGCCTEKDPVFVVIEYVSQGKLQSYLRNSRVEKNYNNTHGKSKTLTSGDLTNFMYQVARGMDFLTSRGIIHRDLAARNVLITDDHTCKVADFGFARDVVTSKVYERKSEGRLPIRWMAIESLYDNLFSVKSDIWSFGILMWEIVTLGSTPYPGMGAADVMKKVRDGYRLEKPEHCRRELYNIMYYCWAKDSNDRPAFSELVQMLDKLLLTETDYIELERFPDHNYYNMLNISGEKL